MKVEHKTGHHDMLVEAAARLRARAPEDAEIAELRNVARNLTERLSTIEVETVERCAKKLTELRDEHRQREREMTEHVHDNTRNVSTSRYMFACQAARADGFDLALQAIRSLSPTEISEAPPVASEEVAKVVEGLKRTAKGKRELAAECSSREIGDKWDDEVAAVYRDEADELDQSAALLTALDARVRVLEQVRDTVGKFSLMVTELETKLAAAEAERDGMREALKVQVSKIDAWAADTVPGNAAAVLLAVGSIARRALSTKEAG